MAERHISDKGIVTGPRSRLCLCWESALLSGKQRQPPVAQLQLAKGVLLSSSSLVSECHPYLKTRTKAFAAVRKSSLGNSRVKSSTKFPP